MTVAIVVTDQADWDAKALPLREFLARYRLEFSDQALLNQLKDGTAPPTEDLLGMLLGANPDFAFYADDFYELAHKMGF